MTEWKMEIQEGRVRLKIIVGMSGATGAIFGVRILQFLKEAGVETHLVLSSWARTTLQLETSFSAEELEKLADFSHSHKDQSASI